MLRASGFRALTKSQAAFASGFRLPAFGLWASGLRASGFGLRAFAPLQIARNADTCPNAK